MIEDERQRDTEEPGAPVSRVVLSGGVIPAGFERVAELVEAARSPETRRAYAASWRRWHAWAVAEGLAPMPAPPGALARWIAARSSTSSIATVRRDVAAVVAVHRAAGHPSPRDELARVTLRGAAAAVEVAGPGPSSPLRAADVRAMVDRLGDSVRDVRDRALILVGWLGVLRREELAALRWRDVRIVGQGVELTIRRGKGQRGRGDQLVGVARQRPPYCPVEALERLATRIPCGPDDPVWPAVGGGEQLGPALSARSVYQRIVSRARAAGVVGRVSAHSLRSGGLTEAAAQGRPDLALADHARHASINQTRRYIRPGSLWLRNPTHGLL